MKKKLFLLVGVASLMLSSCTVYQSYQITGNPIGTKTGEASSKLFGVSDYSIKTAAEKGKITKIGAVEYTYKYYLIIPKITTKVYGE